MEYTVDVRGLRKSFGGREVLAGLDLRVRPGEVFALLGPNGAGKTTTVRILSTLLRPDAGRVVVAGYDVVAEPGAARGAISLTGQYTAVDQILTGRENLVMVGRLRRLGRAGARRRAAELLDQFGLADAADRRVATYSGGMRRRLDLAMSLVVRPALLVLDEPTTGLDPRSRRDVWEAVTALVSSGVTLLLTTQYLEEADALADRVAVIDRGRAVAEGTPAELKAQVGRETVELAYAGAEAAARAARAARALAAAGRGPAVVEEADRPVVRVAGDGTAEDVHRVLDAVAAVGAPADRLTLRRPSLDEVFLALTDRPPDAPDAPGASGGPDDSLEMTA
ncbi:MAG TPA: ATP-binding cassette domain-containing protein [Acidimicrobiales bacterium]